VPPIWEVLFSEFQREVNLRLANGGTPTGQIPETICSSRRCTCSPATIAPQRHDTTRARRLICPPITDPDKGTLRTRGVDQYCSCGIGLAK